MCGVFFLLGFLSYTYSTMAWEENVRVSVTVYDLCLLAVCGYFIDLFASVAD